MPTYEYRCKSCGEHLEVVQSFADDPLTECPACGGDLRKVFGSIGIAFKGSGFYRTDSRAASGASRGGNGTTGEAAAASSSSESSGSGSSSGSSPGSSSGSSSGSAESGSGSSASSEAASA
jgi:putative FmdB family regulatory protein